MALDFPASPTVGETYGRWYWDGEKWLVESGTDPVPTAVRYFTLPDPLLVPNTQTVAIPFVDNAGNGQGNPGIGNPVAGRATFSAPGVYTIGARLRIASSFSVTGSAIALSNNGSAIQSQAAHGAFAQPSAYFLYTHLPDTADVSLGVQYFNIQGSDATISGAEITVMRVADIVW